MVRCTRRAYKPFPRRLFAAFTTSFLVPPPEDTRCPEIPSRPSHIAFHLGRGPLHNDNLLFGVDRLALQLTCGLQQFLVELWTAQLSTPRFTVNAYDTSFVFASLAHEDVASAKKFETLLKAVVSLDGSDQVRVYAKYLGVPLFEGPDALYWCLRHRVSSA